MKIFDFKRLIGYFNFHSSAGAKADAYMDWKAINIFFAIFLALVLLTDGYVSWVNLSGWDRDIFLNESKPAAVNRASLNSALEKIKKRQADFDNKLNAPVVRDPSV